MGQCLLGIVLSSVDQCQLCYGFKNPSAVIQLFHQVKRFLCTVKSSAVVAGNTIEGSEFLKCKSLSMLQFKSRVDGQSLLSILNGNFCIVLGESILRLVQ